MPRLVVCHLGGGCSVTAVRDGRSVDTTMGFTPLEGLPMATRSGSVDPGLLLYLLRHGRRDVDELEHALEHESGLLGLSGLSPHVHELEAARRPATSAPARARVYARRIAQAVAAAAVALGGLDAHRLHRPAPASARRGSARASARGSASSASSSTRRRTRRRAATARSRAARRARRRRRAREDLVIARAVRRTLAPARWAAETLRSAANYAAAIGVGPDSLGVCHGG